MLGGERVVGKGNPSLCMLLLDNKHVVVTGAGRGRDGAAASVMVFVARRMEGSPWGIGRGVCCSYRRRDDRYRYKQSIDLI